MRAAAEAHPGWENLSDGSIRWLGSKGPATPKGLRKWFLATHPQDSE